MQTSSIHTYTSLKCNECQLPISWSMPVTSPITTLPTTKMIGNGENIVGVVLTQLRSKFNRRAPSSCLSVTKVIKRIMLLHQHIRVWSVGNSLVQLWSTTDIAELTRFDRTVVKITSHIHIENSITIFTWCTWSWFRLSSIMSVFHPDNYTAKKQNRNK